MDKAKAAVSNFLSKDGKHETTVHEKVNPAIEHERVIRTQQEEQQKVIDREIHQDHYHTTVQPIQAKEVLPEQHHHNMVGAETREFRHGNPDHVKERLAAEAAQFKHHREVGDVQHSQVEAAVVAGEHIHHHVHETIQPVVQKETIQPSVVHTTIPVHEVHHNEAKHHSASALPPITMEEFKHQGGALGGRDVRTDGFAGEPRAVGSTLGSNNHGILGGHGASGTTSLTGREGNDGALRHGANGTNVTGRDGVPEGTAGPHHSRIANAADPRIDSDMDGSRHNNANTGRSGVPEGTAGPHNSRIANAADPRVDSDMDGSRHNDSSNMTGSVPPKKASLLDKLNPKIDSNGDGKAGFMK